MDPFPSPSFRAHITLYVPPQGYLTLAHNKHSQTTTCQSPYPPSHLTIVEFRHPQGVQLWLRDRDPDSRILLLLFPLTSMGVEVGGPPLHFPPSQRSLRSTSPPSPTPAPHCPFTNPLPSAHPTPGLPNLPPPLDERALRAHPPQSTRLLVVPGCPGRVQD